MIGSAFAVHTVPVLDGALTYHSTGSGPGVVLAHGAMQSASSHADLADLVADRFTVHLMDRRGRGASAALPLRDPETEIEDLRAVVHATNSRCVIGVSSGALLAARLALTESSLDRLLLFEPPLSMDDSMRLQRVTTFDAATATGDLGRAMAVAMRISEMGPPWMFRLPIPLLAAACRRTLSVGRRPLAVALAADVAIVQANADRVADFATLTTPTLLLTGTATRPYLRAAAAVLAATIPEAQHVKLIGNNHAATQNRDEFGTPDSVAPAIRDFLT